MVNNKKKEQASTAHLGYLCKGNPNSEFSQRILGDNSPRHFCINQPSGGKSTQAFHKWARLDFSALFQEELNSESHTALKSTD